MPAAASRQIEPADLALAVAVLRARKAHGDRPRRVDLLGGLSPLDWSLRYAQLAHPIMGRLAFRDVIRDYQRDLLADASERIVIVKARQIGISQTLAFIAAHEALRGGTVLVVSRTGKQAALFLQYVYTALLDAPHPPYKRQNQETLEFEGAGAIYVEAASPGAGRGIPASLVILDEMAWMEYGDAIYTAVMPTLSNGGRAILCSTPYGRNNLFYRIWAGGDAAWGRHELPWRRRQDWAADPDWERAKTNEIGREAFAQEYGCDFAVSGGAVFDPADLDAFLCLDGLAEPDQGRRYLTAWDIGRRQDATVGVTFDRTAKPYRLVAYDRFLHLPYPDVQAAIEARHRRYPGATVVESNGVGDPVIQNLRVRVEEFVTTARTKKDAIDALQLGLQRRDLQAPDLDQMRRELTLYQRDDKDLVQDVVMALAMAAYRLLREAPAVAPASLTRVSPWGPRR